MKRRPGHTYLILDSKRLTLAFGGAYFTDGSHRPFRVEGYWRGKGWQSRRFGVTIPTLSFMQARRWRLLWAWKAQGRVLHKLFCTRH